MVRTRLADGWRAPAVPAGRPYDLVFANILARPLCRMAKHLAAGLAPGGTVILAGLLDTQARGVLAAHRRQGLRLERRPPGRPLDDADPAARRLTRRRLRCDASPLAASGQAPDVGAIEHVRDIAAGQADIGQLTVGHHLQLVHHRLLPRPRHQAGHAVGEPAAEAAMGFVRGGRRHGVTRRGTADRARFVEVEIGG